MLGCLALALLLAGVSPAVRDALAEAVFAGALPAGELGFADPPGGFPEELPEDAEMSVTFELGTFDRYVWRGLRLTDGPVLQPSVTVSRGALSANVWGNMDLDNVNGNESQYNEIDVTLGYEYERGPFGLTASLINYNFPNTLGATTTEFCIAASFDVPSQPAVSIYLDTVETLGSYTTLGLSHAFSSEYENPVAWELTLGVGIGWGSAEHNELYFGSAVAAATDFHGGLVFAFKLHDKWTVSQSIMYLSVVDDELREVTEKSDTAAYGMVLTVEF